MENLEKLEGLSLIGFRTGGKGKAFTASNPATGDRLEDIFYTATSEDIETAVQLAESAFISYSNLSGAKRSQFLRRIAEGVESQAEEVICRAGLETGLLAGRLQGELARTANQLRLFAEVAEEGSWVEARLDSPDPARKPNPKPDLRSLLRPLGPVAVFGASNFPLAYSVAGGDTASALAAGNPVIVKAHPAHPGTSEIVGRVIRDSVRDLSLPEGVFSLLFDAGIEVGQALVEHTGIAAVGFTGSRAGGTALMKLAAARPVPIPVYAEMGSVNPIFILPKALKKRGTEIAAGLYASVTLGAGQFCTKPGMVFLPDREQESERFHEFLKDLGARIQATAPQTMLTEGIASRYARLVEERARSGHARAIAKGGVRPADKPAVSGQAELFTTDVKSFFREDMLAQEIFGPETLLISYGSRQEMIDAANALEGHLTATVHAEEGELEDYSDLVDILVRKAGRLIVNGYPTGVEVGHAIVHGGPFPATSDGMTTSVGSRAISRFARLVCYQDFPEAALPDELKKTNPLVIWRLVDGEFAKG